MPLKIVLRPGERMVVNGALLRVGGRHAAELHLDTRARVLRNDALMAANQAITPARRLYFAAQLAYLDPAHLDQHRKLFLSRFEDLISVVSGQEGKAALHQCAIAAAKTDWWESMRAARRLIDYEAGLMGPAATWQKNFAESDELTSDVGDLLSAREGTC